MRTKNDKEMARNIVDLVQEGRFYELRESIYNNMLRKIRDVLIAKKSKIGSNIVRY